VGNAVTAVTGLDTLAHWVTPASEPDVPGQDNGHRVTLGAPAGFVNAGPCSSWYGEKTYSGSTPVGDDLPYAVCGYTPSQFRSVYGVTASGRTGRGVTVAFTDAFEAPTLSSDADTYATRHGDAAFTTGQYTQTHGRGYDPQRVADCGGNGWYGEQSLDLEAIHGIAPEADVAYYGAASCYDDDLMGVLAQAVSDDSASLISNSWGEPTVVQVPDPADPTRTLDVPTVDDSLAAAYESIFMQGAAQGQGFYFSSGDDGDDVAAWGLKQTDYPASDPLVTAVGGTALAVGRSGARTFETGWGTNKYSLRSDGTWRSVGYLYGAGGGCALTGDRSEPELGIVAHYGTTFAKPAYQTGTTCSSRGVPDIAMDGDPTTGMLVGETQAFGAQTVWGKGVKYGEYRIGGTSLASPLMAGLNAVAQQGRSRIGFANPLIYSTAVRSTLFDVTPQGDAGNVRVDYANGLNGDAGTLVSVRTLDTDASLTTAPGWDVVTGNGSPTAAYIAAVNGS
jgi:subtilase family serine protease